MWLCKRANGKKHVLKTRAQSCKWVHVRRCSFLGQDKESDSKREKRLRTLSKKYVTLAVNDRRRLRPVRNVARCSSRRREPPDRVYVDRDFSNCFCYNSGIDHLLCFDGPPVCARKRTANSKTCSPEPTAILRDWTTRKLFRRFWR